MTYSIAKPAADTVFYDNVIPQKWTVENEEAFIQLLEDFKLNYPDSDWKKEIEVEIDYIFIFATRL